MRETDLKKRTKIFALSVIKLTGELKSNRANNIISNQLIRSATSVGANYTSACFAKSKPDFLNKIKIVEEEIIETKYWLELLIEINQDAALTLTRIIRETDELTAIFVASIKTIKSNLNK